MSPSLMYPPGPACDHAPGEEGAPHGVVAVIKEVRANIVADDRRELHSALELIIHTSHGWCAAARAAQHARLSRSTANSRSVKRHEFRRHTRGRSHSGRVGGSLRLSAPARTSAASGGDRKGLALPRRARRVSMTPVDDET